MSTCAIAPHSDHRLTLSEEERNELSAITASAEVPHRVKRRCEVILRVADGLPHAQVARLLRVSRPRVIHWAKIFGSARRDRVAVLLNTPRSYTDKEAVAVRSALFLPSPYSLGWTVRSIARETGISRATVGRALRRAGVSIAGLGVLKAPLNLPSDLDKRVTDIVGVFYTSLNRAVAFIADSRVRYGINQQTDTEWQQSTRKRCRRFIEQLRELQERISGGFQPDVELFLKFLITMRRLHPEKEIHLVLGSSDEVIYFLKPVQEFVRADGRITVSTTPNLHFWHAWVEWIDHWFARVCDGNRRSNLFSGAELLASGIEKALRPYPAPAPMPSVVLVV